MRDGERPPQLLGQKEGEYPKKAPIGVYDKEILCEKCEGIFGIWDDYAQSILKDEPTGSTPSLSGNEKVGYEIQQFDYSKIKLFFVSLLWRASVSKHSFYSRIDIGPYGAKAKIMIEENAPGSDEEFGVVLAKFDHPLGETILDPHREKIQNVNYCRFYLGSYVAYIKVDKQRAPLPYRDFQIREDGPMYIIARDLERSKELPLMKKIAKAANNRLQATAYRGA